MRAHTMGTTLWIACLLFIMLASAPGRIHAQANENIQGSTHQQVPSDYLSLFLQWFLNQPFPPAPTPYTPPDPEPPEPTPPPKPSPPKPSPRPPHPSPAPKEHGCTHLQDLIFGVGKLDPKFHRKERHYELKVAYNDLAVPVIPILPSEEDYEEQKITITIGDEILMVRNNTEQMLNIGDDANELQLVVSVSAPHHQTCTYKVKIKQGSMPFGRRLLEFLVRAVALLVLAAVVALVVYAVYSYVGLYSDRLPWGAGSRERAGYQPVGVGPGSEPIRTSV